MTFPVGGPTKIGDRVVKLGFWGMPRQAGDPRVIAGTFTLIDGEGDVLLDVFEGPQGIPGVNAPIFDWQYDSTITNVGDLPNVATLDESDDGRAWLIGTHWYVYVAADGVNGAYHAVDMGIPGPRGLTPDIDVTAALRVTTDPDDLEVIVTPSGDSEHPNFHLEIPSKALEGPPGPTTAIRSAPDYDDSIPPLDGQGVVWDEGASRFKPGDLSPTAAKMYTIPHSEFIAYSGTAGRQLIASINIEAQSVAWYPDVLGHIRWTRGLLSGVQVEVEVRIGDTGVGTGDTSPLCGLAPFDPSTLDATTIANIMPHFSDVGNPSRAVAPDSSDGRVPAGQAKTLYVFLHKVGGSGSYTYAGPDDVASQLRLNVLPVS